MAEVMRLYHYGSRERSDVPEFLLAVKCITWGRQERQGDKGDKGERVLCLYECNFLGSDVPGMPRLF
jgi:hypothetical protein